MPLPYPVIVVSGITVCYLEDRYPPLNPETLWTVLKHDFGGALYGGLLVPGLSPLAGRGGCGCYNPCAIGHWRRKKPP